jgi:hypothetical protein
MALSPEDQRPEEIDRLAHKDNVMTKAEREALAKRVAELEARRFQTRGDLMRRIAALYVQLDSLGHDEKSAEREELKRQIAALNKQLMA